MLDQEIIIGIHSIASAISNPKRTFFKLIATEDAVGELKKIVDISKVEYEIYASHKVQELAKNYFRDLSFEYQRVPAGMFLITSPLEMTDVDQLYKDCESRRGLKILALDQISDVHNAAAILRTANFYGVDYVIIPDKKSFGLSPSFFRIASGAAEYTKLVPVNKLTKTMTKLLNLNVDCIALSEHAKDTFSINDILSEGKSICLVLGKEDTGISHAVLRLINHRISLLSHGQIKSLNVSTAAAITMEKCFGKK